MTEEKGIGLKSWLTGPGKAKVPVVAGHDSHDKPAVVDVHRVAVLPFANMSPNSEDEYFADGMTEELISTLSKLPGLQVISRTSVMQYKKQAKTVADIGRE